MTNYAWANPSTGAREQTLKTSDPEELQALESQARHILWSELQAMETPRHSAFFWCQIVAGSVSSEGSDIEGDGSLLDYATFAWCDPETGKRARSRSWPEFRSGIFSGEVTSVVIYAEVEEFIVRRSDPEPQIHPLPRTRPKRVGSSPERVGSSPEESPIAGWKRRLEDYTALDSELLTQATAWALLDIAESLRTLGGIGLPVPMDVGPLSRQLKDDLKPEPEPELCTCTGDGIRPGGAFCSCEPGRALAREHAVKERNAK
jgi:hypothetical protein